MAKKKSNNNAIGFLKFIALLLGVGALVLALLNSVTFTDKVFNKDVSLTGFQVMFGYSEEILGAQLEYTAFSLMATLAFVLPLLGGILQLFNNKLIKLISVACFVGSAVLLFMLPSLVVTEIYIADLFTGSLAIGAILSAICTIFGALISLYIIFKN